MNKDFFLANRNGLQKVVGTSLIVLTGYTSLQRAGDAAHPFSQESNFWWLTGIERPDWWLIMDGKQSILVSPETSQAHHVFDGSLSAKDAQRISGVDKVITNEQAEQYLVKLAKKYPHVVTLGREPFAKHYDFALNPAPQALYRKLKRTFRNVEDCRLELAKLRAIKQPVEIAAIKKAVALTVDAFQAVRQQLPSYGYEYEIEADFTHYFRSRGAAGHAYDPIVAFGVNACTLHYIDNQAKFEQGLVLLDVGARVDGYAADITRTYAIGKVSKRQRDVHKAVESAHHKVIGLLRPGLSIIEYHEQVDVIMKEALDGLGLLKKPEDYRRYFPHAISHGLGVDVHDALGRPTEFLPGMILTVEPGIYIPEEGIGVRIEDDILITKDGHENLSAALSTAL